MIRKLGKYGKTICLQCCQAHDRPRIISSMKNSPRKHNGSTYIKFQVDFLLMNLREIPAVCEQTCLIFLGTVSLTLFQAPCLPDHRWLNSDQQYYLLHFMHYIIIARGKPFRLAECSTSLAFRNKKLCKIVHVYEFSRECKNIVYFTI